MSCPLCRSVRLNKNELNKNLIAFQIINELEIYCPHKSRGCKWQGAIDRASSHMKQCEFNNDNLSQWLVDLMPALEQEYEKQAALNEANEEEVRDKLMEEEDLPLSVRLYRRNNPNINQ